MTPLAGLQTMKTFFAFSLICFATCSIAAADQRPNVVFILVDDLGWSDVSYNGSQVYETPHIDRLAEQGAVLTDFYSAGPVCSPTRASIMTGKSPARLGLTKWLHTPKKDPPFVAHHLPLAEFTVAEAFREAGYATGYFGKWHLGYKEEHWAAHQGFEVAKGGIDSPHAWALAWPEREITLPEKHTRFFSPYHLTHLENGPGGEYLTERLTNETMAFIEQQRAEPFFAVLAFHTVHTPLEAKPEKVAKYAAKIKRLGLDQKQEQNRSEKAWQNNADYAAMVEHMDENVGRLLQRLDELQLSENTIVVWTSDNGGKGTVTSNLPLRGAKHNLYEGGIRVPTIIRWPGHIEQGKEISTPLISTDFYPTLLELCGTAQRPQQTLDGASFARVVTGKGAPLERDALYWHYPHSRNEGAIREGKYKLLERFAENSVELYDLSQDLSEQHDLSAAEPELVKRLTEKLHRWQKKVNARFE